LIDIHTHILPGVDDGSSSLAESIKMLAQAEEIGIKTIFATPHLYFYSRFEQTYSTAVQKIAELKNATAENGLSLNLNLGFEVYLHPELTSFPHLPKLTLGQKGAFLLVELALGQIPAFVEKACFDLIINGFTPILAHPERNLISSSQLAILERLVLQGVRLQIEAASLIGQNGPELKKASLLLLQKNLVSFVASDAHNPKRDFNSMAEAYHLVKKQAGEQKAFQLFNENQEEILSVQAVQIHLDLPN
jgi:protein-tyrosine phosphatase